MSVVDNYKDILLYIEKENEKETNKIMITEDSKDFEFNFKMLEYETYATSSLYGILAFFSSVGCVDLVKLIFLIKLIKL